MSKRKYDNGLAEVIKENADEVLLEKDGVTFLQFKNMQKYNDKITHCFTTRKGGISSGVYESMNLGFNTGDDKENVFENFKRISIALNIEYKNMVFSNQIHEANVKTVDENDKGKGIIKKSNIIGYDALITDKPGVVLVTFFADCVSVFLYDAEKNVIALAHSGWRGTVKEIARKTIIKMRDEYNCVPSNIIAAVGPSIGSCCFEVGNEVYEEFKYNLPYSTGYCIKINDEKWRIDLRSIIKNTLIQSGISEKSICISTMCTKCNNDLFYSHRRDNNRRGTMASIMQIKPEYY